MKAELLGEKIYYSNMIATSDRHNIGRNNILE